MRTSTATAFAALLLLVVAACGDSGTTTTAGAPVTSGVPTTVPPPTTTPATTMAPTTTTTLPPTTTTVPPTTTTAAPVDAQATVDAKTAAVVAAAPEGWATEVTTGPGGDDDTDEVFGACAEPGAFDLTQLDASSAAIAEALVEGPVTGLFPGPSAAVEARVFVSEEVAAEAFAVLETVFGTEEGRQCLAEVFEEQIEPDLPPDSEFSFSIDELAVADADEGVRISFEIGASGITANFFIDIVADLEGACTVFATYQSFTNPFDAVLQMELFAAARNA